MPALAERLVLRPGAPAPTRRAAAAPPPSAACALLMIQEAILRDAAADVARIGLQMARAQSTAWLLEHGLAAVDVLDRTIRLLQGQRPVLLDQLAEVLLSADTGDAPTLECSSADLRSSRVSGRA
jgi:hypothetical protein